MFEDILKGKKSLFETGMKIVLRGQENRVRRIVIKQGNLVVIERAESSGVCAKVYKNGVSGFASMAEYTPEAAEMVLKAATENAHYLYKYTENKKAALSPYASADAYVESKRFIIDFEQKKLVDLCKQVDDYIVNKYPKLTSRPPMLRTAMWLTLDAPCILCSIWSRRTDSLLSLWIWSEASDMPTITSRICLRFTLSLTLFTSVSATRRRECTPRPELRP